MLHPKMQKKGIGTKLLSEIENEYPNQRYELFTSTRSKKNIVLYHKLGYKIFDEKQVTEELGLCIWRKDKTVYTKVGKAG